MGTPLLKIAYSQDFETASEANGQLGIGSAQQGYWQVMIFDQGRLG